MTTNSVLFTTSKGEPVSFFLEMSCCEAEFVRIKKLIYKYGGFTVHTASDMDPYTVHIVDDISVHLTSVNSPMFFYNFVEDSVTQGRFLNLKDYLAYSVATSTELDFNKVVLDKIAPMRNASITDLRARRCRKRRRPVELSFAHVPVIFIDSMPGVEKVYEPIVHVSGKRVSISRVAEEEEDNQFHTPSPEVSLAMTQTQTQTQLPVEDVCMDLSEDDVDVAVPPSTSINSEAVRKNLESASTNRFTTSTPLRSGPSETTRQTMAITPRVASPLPVATEPIRPQATSSPTPVVTRQALPSTSSLPTVASPLSVATEPIRSQAASSPKPVVTLQALPSTSSLPTVASPLSVATEPIRSQAASSPKPVVTRQDLPSTSSLPTVEKRPITPVTTPSSSPSLCIVSSDEDSRSNRWYSSNGQHRQTDGKRTRDGRHSEQSLRRRAEIELAPPPGARHVRQRNFNTRAAYSEQEKRDIIKHLVSLPRTACLRGNRVWKDLEDLNIIPTRSHQSLKNHFLKTLVGDLDKYTFLSKEDKDWLQNK